MDAGIVQNHAPFAAREKMSERFPRAKEWPPQVHGEDAIEVGGLHLVARARLLNSGVVHQNIQIAEGVDRSLKHRLHLMFLGNVRGDDNGLAIPLSYVF